MKEQIWQEAYDKIKQENTELIKYIDTLENTEPLTETEIKLKQEHKEMREALKTIAECRDYEVSCNVGVHLFTGKTEFGEMQWKETKLEDIRNIAKDYFLK